ncbi:MAG: putative transposase, partial [Haloquadratum sp. J07HQX50]
MKRATFPMTGNSKPNSKTTNATRTYILNPVSVEELAEAFTGWYQNMKSNDQANPPGDHKNGNSNPRSTMSFKPAGFNHDAQFTCVRLLKGRNLKKHRSDFMLCEYQTRPDVDLAEWDIQSARAVFKRDEWRLQHVCRTLIDPEPPGDEVAGVDLEICNF